MKEAINTVKTGVSGQPKIKNICYLFMQYKMSNGHYCNCYCPSNPTVCSIINPNSGETTYEKIISKDFILVSSWSVSCNAPDHGDKICQGHAFMRHD